MVPSKAALVLFRIIVAGTMLGATALAEPAPKSATAVLAGGCFWCVEHDMRQLSGVTEAASGYSGGSRPNPTYEDYHDVDAANPVPHLEAVRVTYNPSVLSYEKLLDYYFHHIDPTDGGGQFCDRGPAYRPAVFVGSEAERKVAEAKKAEVAKLLNQKVRSRTPFATNTIVGIATAISGWKPSGKALNSEESAARISDIWGQRSDKHCRHCRSRNSS